MNRSQQFQLSHLLIGTTLLALLVFLIVRWWQLTVLLGVSILPAILCVICLKQFGKLKPLYACDILRVGVGTVVSIAVRVECRTCNVFGCKLPDHPSR